MYKILTFICVTSIYLNYDFCKLIILFLVNYLMANFIEIVTDCLFGMNIYLLKVRNKIRQYYIDFHFWYKQNDMKSFQNSAKVTKKVHQKNETHFQKKNKGNFQKINKRSFQKKNKGNLQKENKGSLKNEMNTKYKRQRNENLSQKIIKNRDVYFRESFIKNPSFSKDKSLKGKRQTQPKYSNVGRMQPKYLDVKNFEQFHRKLIHADVCMKIYSEWFCSCLHCRCGVTYLCDQKLCEFCSSPVYTYTGNEPEIYYK